MYNLCFASDLTSAEWAAWVGSIGTVVAIAGAYAIARWQWSRQLLRDKIARDEASAHRTRITIAAVAQVGKACRDIRGVYGGAAVAGIQDRAGTLLIDARSLLSAIPLFEMPDADLAIDVLKVREKARPAQGAIKLSAGVPAEVHDLEAECDVFLKRWPST